MYFILDNNSRFFLSNHCVTCILDNEFSVVIALKLINCKNYISICTLNDCDFLYLGARGLEGEVGRPGLPGFTTPSGFLLVRHSQSQELPRCPDGANQIWNGYSLLYIEGNERSHHQDLGKYKNNALWYTLMLILM